MLDLNDERWRQLHGGYRVPYDPRDAFKRIASVKQAREGWRELWEELHHQGSIGEASYAAVPHILRLHRAHGEPDWNPYGLVATIEICRPYDKNPPVPEWLKPSYENSLAELAGLGCLELGQTTDETIVSSILGLVALWRGARVYGSFLVRYSQAELTEMEDYFMEGG